MPARVAVLPSLEGADPLLGDVDNLFPFYDAGVRLLTLAWGDNPFCGSTYGEGTGLTKKGADLVAACESLGVVVDVSHLSDKGFADLCLIAERPFVASHSNCRSLCPSSRNLTDEMIRALAERGGVMGITLAPGFLSPDYYEKERIVLGRSFQTVLSGEETFDEAQVHGAAAMAGVPRPPLSTVLDHVRWAINLGGEDSVGLGGDLDGVDYLPAGFEGAADYPRIEELLRDWRDGIAADRQGLPRKLPARVPGRAGLGAGARRRPQAIAFFLTGHLIREDNRFSRGFSPHPMMSTVPSRIMIFCSSGIGVQW